MAQLTLFDLATLQRNDPYTGLIEDVTTLAPEFSTVVAVPRSGTWYEIVSRTALPTAQFRNVNEGVTPSKSSYKKMLKEMFFVDVNLNVDEAVIKGDDGSVGNLWMLEAEGAMRNTSILLGSQFYYGTSADAKGFQGLRAQIAGNIAAGGTTNSTSAYLVWMDAQQGVRFDVGRDGAFNISTPVRQQVANSTTTSSFAWVGNLSAYVGLTVGSDKSVWAVTGITTHTTGSPAVYDQNLTDQTAQLLISNIPVARRSNLRWFFNRTSQFLLQQSRTTINVGAGYSLQAAGSGGTPAWAPMPDRLAGYPITLTDSITNTESN